MQNYAMRLAAALAAVTMIAAPAQAHDDLALVLETARAEAMAQATLGFLATLDEAQRAQVLAPLDDVPARTGWSNLPVSMAPRSGLAVTQMDAAQRIAFHAMLSAALSSRGYLTTTTIMSNEDVLHDVMAQQLAALPDSDPQRAEGLQFIQNYDAELFFVQVFGDPATGDWGWGVTGHHYAANFTVSDGQIGFTPLFLGANPQIVPSGRFAGFRLLQHEADRALALVGSLEGAALAQALIADEVDGAVFAGPGRQDRYPTPMGVSAADLDPMQLRLLEGLIDEFLGDASDEAAARQRMAIEADGHQALHFAWWGPIDQPLARFMFRVQGPSILIDYVREPSNDGGYNHVHSIVRDPANDYGSQWLAQHYDEAHGT